MEQYEEACNYILKTAMLQKEVIRFVMDSIEGAGAGSSVDRQDQQRR